MKFSRLLVLLVVAGLLVYALGQLIPRPAPAIALPRLPHAARPHAAPTAPAKPTARPTQPTGFDPESMMARMKLLEQQPLVLGAALDGLLPQRAGHVDLYTIGFAGDGEERVFGNEVDYFAQLMARRFDAEGHALSLVNSPAPRKDVPLATLSNLRVALKAIAKRMDPEEDVLVLFLTSHGSRKHSLVVELAPFTLEQIRPPDLRQALDEAGIRWRVVIVSACYSGGFVPELRDPRTLVITAARSDRSSFGCGSESKLTWFGDAYLVGALNKSTDFQLAFRDAQASIRQWEKREGDTPSEPQVYAGSEIGAKLAAWRATAKPAGAPVPFTGE